MSISKRSYHPHKEMLHRGNKAEQEARNERRQKELTEGEDEEETNTTPGKRKKRKVIGSRCEEAEKQSTTSRVEAPVRRRRSGRGAEMCEFSSVPDWI